MLKKEYYFIISQRNSDMAKLKRVSRDEFIDFLMLYKSKFYPHQRGETCLYCDFNRPSEHAIGTGERVDDSLIAKSYEPWFNLPCEYYILVE